MTTAQEIRAALEPVLAPLGLVVEDVSVSPAGKRRVVRVLVDTDISDLDAADTTSAIAPMTLDGVAEATRLVSDELDADGVLGQSPYTLEVSSPGVGRPLTSRDQFRRQVGRLVEVVHADGTDTGRLTDVGADRLTLEVEATKKSPGRRISLDLDGVRRGTVQVEFSRAEPAGDAGDHATDRASDHAGHDDSQDDRDPTSPEEGDI